MSGRDSGGVTGKACEAIRNDSRGDHRSPPGLRRFIYKADRERARLNGINRPVSTGRPSGRGPRPAGGAAANHPPPDAIRQSS